MYRRDTYYSDAYRTIANIAMDYAWFSQDMENQMIGTATSPINCSISSVSPPGIGPLGSMVDSQNQQSGPHPMAITATNAKLPWC